MTAVTGVKSYFVDEAGDGTLELLAGVPVIYVLVPIPEGIR